MSQLNVSLPAFHTISYVGSLTTILKLHFHPIPSIFEHLTVNESTVIQRTAGTFQRNIAIDANDKRIWISLTVRKFFGATDYCGYGGLRMFNHVNISVNRHNKQAYVPYDNIKHNLNVKYLKKSRYIPICTNDSFIFKRKFYLGFGTTYIVFYDFNSMWNIDLTLDVHSSEFNPIYNFEQIYCIHLVQVYVFNDFFINCNLMVVRLTQQVPLILQWPRENKNLEKNALGNIEVIWSGNMDLILNHKHRNLRIFNIKNQLCRSKNMLHITNASSTVKLLLDRNLQTYSVANAEYFTIARSLSNCYYLEESSYAITLTPSPGSDRCSSSRTAVGDTVTRNSHHKRINDGCVSLDVVLRRGVYVFYFMEPFFNIIFQDHWTYYSLTISEGCHKRLGMKVHFKTTLAKKSRMVHYEFTQGKHHYVWYNYGIVGVLMFHLERILMQCFGYIEMTSSPQKQDHLQHVQPNFKVKTKISNIN